MTTFGSLDAAEVADVEGVLVTAGVVVVVLVALGCLHPGFRRRVLDLASGTGTLLAAGIALLATAGSLWFSEGAGFPPCELCWYQRIAMYPLVAILGLAAMRDSATGRLTGLVVGSAGLLVSGWHNLIETYPSLDSGSCDATNPCTIRWVEGLGFWTIPRMAAACFAFVLVFTLADHLAARSPRPPTEAPA